MRTHPLHMTVAFPFVSTLCSTSSFSRTSASSFSCPVAILYSNSRMNYRKNCYKNNNRNNISNNENNSNSILLETRNVSVFFTTVTKLRIFMVRKYTRYSETGKKSYMDITDNIWQMWVRINVGRRSKCRQWK